MYVILSRIIYYFTTYFKPFFPFTSISQYVKLKKFIKTIKNKMNKQKIIDFSPPLITEEDINEVIKVLRSGWITTGPKVSALEEALKKYTEAEAIAVLGSATSSMELILRILDIKEGDEVITTPYTFTASASVIQHVGASIVFADVAPDSFLISPENIAEKITNKTKAIITVDYGGTLCNYEAIQNIVKEKKHLYAPVQNSFASAFKNIPIIADSSHAFGAELNGIKTGAIADFSVFSFHAVKNLTTAEGGAICIKNNSNLDIQKFLKFIKLYSLHGQNNDAFKKTEKGWQYDIIFPGYKFNMTDIQAALGLSQLNRYPETLKFREKIFKRYLFNLKTNSNFILPCFDTDQIKSSYHLFPVRINGFNEENRDKLISYMKKQGIATNVHFKPLPMMTAYKNLGFSIKDYPNAFKVYENVITLPVHQKLSLDDVDYITDNLKQGIIEIIK